MEFITDTLYWISTGLLVPVIIALILLFLSSLLLLGNFFAHFQQVAKNTKLINEAFEGLSLSTIDQLEAKLPAKSKGFLFPTIKRLLDNRESSAMVEKTLSDFELFVEKDLSKPKMLAKLGPMLGLMGTLIPMGPALVGLSTGDIASMAYNMQVAFATTVVGLFAAAVGFIALQLKQRWYKQDFANVQFVADLIEESNEKKK